MPIPLLAYGAVAVGGVLLSPSDSGSQDQIAKDVGFNHPERYKQIHEGAGPSEMTTAADNLKGAVSGHFGKALELLETANRDANVAWQGKAAEQFGNSTKPMTSFLTNAQSTSQAAGESVDRQVDSFLTVRNAMPEPKKVDATDNLLEKGGAWLVGGETDLQKQEREATEAAQAAKQTYDTYDNNIRTEVQNPPRFDPPPNQSGDQGQSSFDRSGAINSPMGVGSGGSGAGGSGGSAGGIGGVGGGSGFGPGGSSFPDTPSGSGSSWAPGGGSTMPAPAPGGIGLGGGAGAGAGAGGLGMMPGMGPGGAGAGAGAGGRAGAGGMGAGGRAGAGGAGAANQPGAGGRSGIGTPGGGMAGAGGAGAKGAGAGGRGGMGMGGGMGAGRGGQGGEDDEHEHPSWLEEQDDVWLNDMPRTAPPVFGE